MNNVELHSPQCINTLEPIKEKPQQEKIQEPIQEIQQQKYLYIPPEIWKIIIGHLRDECNDCGGKICKQCMHSKHEETHKLCKTCDKTICPTQKSFKCMSCSSEVHKECYVHGTIKKSEFTTYSITYACKPCFEKKRELLLSWSCIP